MATLVRGIAALRALHYAPPKRTASTKIRPSLGALASRFQKPSTRSRIDAASSSIDEADGGPPPEGGEQQEAAATEDGSFADFDIDDRVLGFLPPLGIINPTDVQRAAIPAIMSGDNVAVQCYTGSGKTLAYLLPVLSLAIQRSDAEWAQVTRKTAGQAGTVQAVIVAPSRELAMQIMRVAQSLLPEAARRAVQQCIGGANIARQRESLKLYKPLIVVGTPGRLAELSRDGALQTHRCGILVMDEVDQLLAPQFREEMSRIAEHTGKRCSGGRQTIAVSATLTPRVLALCAPWCPNPKQVFINPPVRDAIDAPSTAEREGSSGPSWGWGAPGTTYHGFGATIGSAGGYGNTDTAPAIAPGLKHLYVSSAPHHRVDTLRRAIHAVGAQRALVFMNFQQRLKDAEGKLAARKMPVGSLHGEMTKQERQATLDAFRAGKFRALLVSDVAARGLDVPECDAVFNLELPSDAAHYAHRAGRTARAGRGGTVVSLVSGGEQYVVEKLGRRLGVEIKGVKLTGGEIDEVPEGGYARDAAQARERRPRSTAERNPDFAKS